MRLSLLFVLLTVISVTAKNKTRLLKLTFPKNCFTLTELHKEQIVNEYILVGSGDWLKIESVSIKTYKKNKKLALVTAKKRNRLITHFLAEKGLNISDIIFKYDLIERIWVHKPNQLKSSAKLKHKSDRSCYTFKNSDGITAQLSSGNSVFFKANSFDAFLSSEINVCIEEYISKVDFVKYGVTAQGNKGMLESQGMFNLKATCKGVEVNLKRGVVYELKIKGGNDLKPFYAFFGNEKGGNLNWSKQSDKKFKMSTIQETIISEEFVEDEDREYGLEYWESEVTSLSGSFSKLGWINCDRFYTEEEKITMNFKIESDKPVHVYIVFHDINSVMPAYKIMNGAYTISGIPVGKNISIVALNNDNKSGTGELGFFKTSSNNNQKINFKTERISNVEMTRLLNDVIY